MIPELITKDVGFQKRLLTTALVSGLALTFSAAWAQETPVPIEEGREQFSVEVVATELESPWEITWGPDDRLWVTERAGKRVTRVNPEDGAATTALTIDEVLVGSQQGLLGMALHPELLQDTGNDYVYLAYTYNLGSDEEENIDRRTKISRYTYDAETQELGEPVELLTELPASVDHNAGRLVFGPDNTLYYSIGDQGNNQFGLFQEPIRSQELPTAEQVEAEEWGLYVGKILRLNLDGSIPEDNPEIDGVRSHIYTYGHRNPQALAFGPDGTLYSAEHGPKSDDEVNILQAGMNYGWPNVSGYQDDQAYVYANWSEAEETEEELTFSDYEIPDAVPQQMESEFDHPDLVEPIQTFFTVDDDYDFAAVAGDCGYICWPTVAPGSIAHYSAQDGGIEAWDNSLLLPTLKHGSVYRIALAEDGQSVTGEPVRYFNTENRYRDLALNPDGTTVYIATDSEGLAAALGEAGFTAELENPGSILAFSYEELASE